MTIPSSHGRDPHSRKRLAPSLFLISLALLALPRPARAQDSSTVWLRWEHTLTSSRTYTNAYKDVKLKVTYHKLDLPASPDYTAYAFWDGTSGSLNLFRFRTAFPATGTWSWTTSCEAGCTGDTEIVGVGGQVTVNAYSDPNPNPLYVNGFLKVNPSSPNVSRYLTYANGVPFFWLGDTAWAAPIRVSDIMSEWGSYGNDREAKGFSVVHIAPYAAYAIPSPPPPAPFLQLPSPCVPDSTQIPNSCSYVNPAYWDRFDEMVFDANLFHLVVFVAGVMEPIDDTFPLAANARTFARHLAARLSGDFVVFSPGYDARVTQQLSLIEAVGDEINNATSRHLITDHVAAEPTQPNQIEVHGEPWLDFDMVNSGKGGGGGDLQKATQRARQQPLFLYQKPTTKPVVNGEALYDANDPTMPLFSDFRARQCGYLSLLSGAVGYSYGANPIQQWGWMTTVSPFTAQSWPSAFQMQYLGTLFRSLQWQRLVPSSGAEGSATYGLIRNQELTDQSKKMVLAYDVNGAFLLAYLPDNGQIKIDLSGLPGVPRNGKWFNPKTGTYSATAANGAAQGSGVFAYTRPATGDWVLVLGGPAGLSAGAVRVWTDFRPDGQGTIIMAQLAGGAPFPVSDPGRPGLDRLPAAIQEPAGGFLVAWERGGEVFARHFDAVGRPTTDARRVGSSVGETAPAVAADSAGDFVLTWIATGQGVFARRFDRRGTPLGESFQVTSAATDDQRVAGEPGGGFVVAWAGKTAGGAGTGDGHAIFAQRYSRSGEPLEKAVQVTAASPELQVLTGLELEPAGKVHVRAERVESSGRRVPTTELANLQSFR